MRASRSPPSPELEPLAADGLVHGQHRPRRAVGAADRRRARLATRARTRELPADRVAAVARARGPPAGTRRRTWRVWVDRSIVPAGYGWSFPAGDEVRVGVGSFDPRFHVRTADGRACAARVDRADRRGFQGNWIPHRLRDATERGVFFAGDSAGHCLPFTAEGIRTAFYFGIACGRELREVIEGRSTREQALRRYSAFSEAHRRRFEWLLKIQRTLPRMPAAAAGAHRAGAALAALRRLVVRPLPERRASGLREPAGTRCRRPCGAGPA